MYQWRIRIQDFLYDDYGCLTSHITRSISTLLEKSVLAQAKQIKSWGLIHEWQAVRWSISSYTGVMPEHRGEEGAKPKGKAFDLTVDQFPTLTCGRELWPVTKERECGHKVPEWVAGKALLGERGRSACWNHDPTPDKHKKMDGQSSWAALTHDAGCKIALLEHLHVRRWVLSLLVLVKWWTNQPTELEHCLLNG